MKDTTLLTVAQIVAHKRIPYIIIYLQYIIVLKRAKDTASKNAE